MSDPTDASRLDFELAGIMLLQAAAQVYEEAALRFDAAEDYYSGTRAIRARATRLVEVLGLEDPYLLRLRADGHAIRAVIDRAIEGVLD